MQKIINNPTYVVEDMLEGFVKVHKDLVSNTENERVLKYRHTPIAGKVGKLPAKPLRENHFTYATTHRNR